MKKPNLNQVAIQRIAELGSYTVAGSLVSKCGSGYVVKTPKSKNVRTFASAFKAVEFARKIALVPTDAVCTRIAVGGKDMIGTAGD